MATLASLSRLGGMMRGPGFGTTKPTDAGMPMPMGGTYKPPKIPGDVNGGGYAGSSLNGSIGGMDGQSGGAAAYTGAGTGGASSMEGYRDPGLTPDPMPEWLGRGGTAPAASMGGAMTNGGNYASGGGSAVGTGANAIGAVGAGGPGLADPNAPAYTGAPARPAYSADPSLGMPMPSGGTSPGGPNDNGWGQDPTTMSTTSNPITPEQMKYVRDTQAQHAGMSNRLGVRQAMAGNRGTKIGENGQPSGSDPASLAAQAQAAMARGLSGGNSGVSAFDQHVQQFADPSNYPALSRNYPPAYINGEVTRLQQALAQPAGAGGFNGGGIAPAQRAQLQQQLNGYLGLQAYQAQNPGV